MVRDVALPPSMSPSVKPSSNWRPDGVAVEAELSRATGSERYACPNGESAGAREHGRQEV